MTAARALTSAEAAGVRLTLRPNGTVYLEAPSPPPPGVVAALRHWREEVVELLTLRQKSHVAGAGSAAEPTVAARMRYFQEAAADAATALAAPDAELDEERAVVAAALALASPHQ